MLKSMTAYARASIKNPFGVFGIEIQSVNRKFLEVNCSLPSEFLRFESEIKKWISDRIGRGQVSVKLFVEFDKQSLISIKPNFPLIREIKSAWELIFKELNMQDSFTPDLLAREKGILLYSEDLKEEETLKDLLKELVSLSLDDLIKMKEKEGFALCIDMKERLALLHKNIGIIELLSPQSTEKQRQKLIDKLNEVLPGFVENEERILREVCLFAEKVDIVEEITRFKSHLNQIDELLESKDVLIGKTLEFLLQELNREANTIGSKAANIEITKQVIEIKTELERIREQIQNVE